MRLTRWITRGTLLLGALSTGIAAHSQQPPQPSIQQLRAGFVDPPPAARLRCYWWWLNGNTDKATITNDLEQMKAAGFGGALLVDANGADQEGNLPVPHGPDFGSPAWVELFRHALKEADRLGLEITLNIVSGWNLGGPAVNPEQASKILTWSHVDLHNATAATYALPMPAIKNGFYRQIAVLAYPLKHGTALPLQPGATVSAESDQILQGRSAAIETGFSMPDSSPMLLPSAGPNPADADLADVRDLTAQTDASGTLHWQPPTGDWEILRIGYTDSDARVSTSSAGWQGLAIDYMSRTAFETYWNQVVEPLLTAAKPFHSLKYLASDSWELKGTNWTDHFRDEFTKRRGYDPVLWLPVATGRVIGDSDRSTRFLTDLRRTVADLVVAEHYDVFAEKAKLHGMGTQSESGGPHGAPIDALETFRGAAIAQTEFWSPNPHRASDDSRFYAKEAASAAHIYGKSIIAQEGETSIGPQWSESLSDDLKPSFDMAITEGMNRVVWHEFTSSPAATGLPGQEYFAGTHLNPKVTWFKAGNEFFKYLNRAQFLMQQGRPVNDLLYFYGDNIPAFVRLKADDPAHVLPGYDYDVTNEDALLHTITMQGGKLRGPTGMEWKALALPSTGRLSLPALQRIEAYVREGGVVIGLPPTSPTGQTTSANQSGFAALVAKVWGAGCYASAAHAYGKGSVFCTANAHAAFQLMHLAPDVNVQEAGPSPLQSTSSGELDYIHQQIGATDLYYLRNGSSHASRHDIAFRTAGKKPELWDAVTGEMLAAPSARIVDGTSQLTIELPPYGSTIVAFTNEQSRLPQPLGSSAKSAPAEPIHPWEISFQPDRGGPPAPISTSDLKDWTTSPDPAVRFFSGTATYRTTLLAPEVAPGKRVWLSFADVREIAVVKVNGRTAGTVWAKPYTLRVDQYLKPGQNEIEIEVTNLWPNRIIGDLQPGVTTRITSTNITKYKPSSPLLPSGLIGPVAWLVEP